jgi:hypothetical protein
MTIFNSMSFKQRSYAVQQLIALVETLKEAMLQDDTRERYQLIALDDGRLESASVLCRCGFSLANGRSRWWAVSCGA